jgi:hypothetical protein
MTFSVPENKRGETLICQLQGCEHLAVFVVVLIRAPFKKNLLNAGRLLQLQEHVVTTNKTYAQVTPQAPCATTLALRL